MGIFCYSEYCLLLLTQRTKNLSLSEFNNTILLAGHRSMDFSAPTWKLVLIDTFEKKNCRLILVEAFTIIVYNKIVTFSPKKVSRYKRVNLLNNKSSELGSLYRLIKRSLQAVHVSGLLVTIKSNASPRILDFIRANNASFIASSVVAKFAAKLSHVYRKCDKSFVPSSYTGMASRHIVNLSLNCSIGIGAWFATWFSISLFVLFFIFYFFSEINRIFSDKVRCGLRNSKDLLFLYMLRWFQVSHCVQVGFTVDVGSNLRRRGWNTGCFSLMIFVQQFGEESIQQPRRILSAAPVRWVSTMTTRKKVSHTHTQLNSH